MAKSAWKFLNSNQKEFYRYVTEFKLINERKGMQYVGFKKSTLRINNINFMHRYKFFLGKTYTYKKFFPYCISSIAFEFLKYRKPFHYYSKKKKKKKI